MTTAHRPSPLPLLGAVLGGAALVVATTLAVLSGEPNPLAGAATFGQSLAFLPPVAAHLTTFTAGALAILAALVARRRGRPALTGAAVLALVVVVDHSVLAALGYLPLVLGGVLTGDVTTTQLYLSWPLLLQVLAIAAALSLLFLGAPPRAGVDRDRLWFRTRRWTVIAMEAPLLYALSRVLMFFQVPGFTAPEFTFEVRAVGLGLAAAAVGGAILTWGLIRPWGQVFPRWMLGLAGKRVPINAAVVPALVVALAVMAASKAMLPAMLTGGASSMIAESPLIVLPQLLWPLWSVALALAALNYGRYRRRSPESAAAGTRDGSRWSAPDGENRPPAPVNAKSADTSGCGRIGFRP